MASESASMAPYHQPRGIISTSRLGAQPLRRSIPDLLAIINEIGDKLIENISSLHDTEGARLEACMSKRRAGWQLVAAPDKPHVNLQRSSLVLWFEVRNHVFKTSLSDDLVGYVEITLHIVETMREMVENTETSGHNVNEGIMLQ
ncbi:hypothetical protein ACHAPU_008072 [Fusarium lateritium]